MINLITYIKEQKSFSIESGQYDGNKRPVKEGGYAKAGIIGGIIGGFLGWFNKTSIPGIALGGAALAMLFNWLLNIMDKSDFNTGRGTGSAYKLLDKLDEIIIGNQQDNTVSTTTHDDSSGNDITVSTTTRGRAKRKLEGVVYDIDKDPRGYPISIAYEGSVMIFLLHNINQNQLRFMNNELDFICRKFRYANYKSKSLGKNSYYIEFAIVGDSYWYIPYDLYDAGIKFNVLTLRK